MDLIVRMMLRRAISATLLLLGNRFALKTAAVPDYRTSGIPVLNMSGLRVNQDSSRCRSSLSFEPPVAGPKCNAAKQQTESLALRRDHRTFEECLILNKKWFRRD